MDTPQLTPAILEDAAAALGGHDTDAVLGPAFDGGYWTIGLNQPDPAVFSGVPMSHPDTGRAQARRLDELGLRWAELAPLRDVDTFAAAQAVARLDPSSRFAAALRSLQTQDQVAYGGGLG